MNVGYRSRSKLNQIPESLPLTYGMQIPPELIDPGIDPGIDPTIDPPDLITLDPGIDPTIDPIIDPGIDPGLDPDEPPKKEIGIVPALLVTTGVLGAFGLWYAIR